MAILAGLLFPVMSKARADAQKRACATNMKMIVQALKMYKDDHYVYPDHLYGFSENPDDPSPTLIPRLYPEYISNEKTFNCPVSPYKTNVRNFLKPINPMVDPSTPMPYGFPAFDSYDMGLRPNVAGGTPEQHYAVKWTSGTKSLSDDPRQLVYKNPPESTVVTWCLNHAAVDSSGMPTQGEMALVAFLSGRVDTIPASKVASWPNAEGQQPWQVLPKP
jgi:type II secretory pathway pseudopilin PulG